LLVDFAILYDPLVWVDAEIVGVLTVAIAHLISPRLPKWSPVVQKS
jgi:hypothetical protein